MRIPAKYIIGALAAAVAAHVLAINAFPRMLMNVAIERAGDGGYNQWRMAERVTPASRTIVRPSPDFAYSACPYDLGSGPIVMRVAPWDHYWSLSLYADNSDNFFVIDDREVRDGAEITLVRAGGAAPEGAARVVEGPSRRGIALIRRLAPTPQAYADAARVAQGDVCATLTP